MHPVIELADVPGLKKGYRQLGKTLRERFWEKVNKTETCWLWTAATNSGRYGSFMVVKAKPPKMKAHRVSWLLAYGEIPQGLVVCHKCDNDLCVRPDHLFLGTQSDNLNDCSRKGRWGKRNMARGERCHASRLKESDVVNIRQRYAEGCSISKLAAEYGVSETNIGCVVRRQSWKHVA